MLQEEDNAWSFQRVLSYCTWIWEQANDLVAATAYPNIFELPEPTSKKEDLGLVELACPEDPTVDNPRLKWSQRKDLDDRRWRSLATPILAVLIASCPYPDLWLRR
ncbi:hypothetical protein PIIN_10976 [Serendipita indica DSM 11827]|uniref:Uncharacterized protein n=1 Tax=Serendipita indica (strain DSM 11827) TaxID=1109443 RepID=G4U098_SERID|nr:hypothetical protein PIIN_10976 [Serendipita indica DSM 11827]